jgi:hypothetical protein
MEILLSAIPISIGAIAFTTLLFCIYKFEINWKEDCDRRIYKNKKK